jgi:hypothetical protein
VLPPSDVRNDSEIIVQITEVHTINDIVRRIAFPMSKLAGSNNVSAGELVTILPSCDVNSPTSDVAGCDDGTLTARLVLLNEEAVSFDRWIVQHAD